MKVEQLKHLADERWIHDSLLLQAREMVKQTYVVWRKHRKIDPFIFTWPAVRIRTDAGEPHEGLTALQLPDDSKEWPEQMRMLVERTKAYALLLIEQRGQDVKGTFESSFGSRCWTIPVERHGDVHILGNMSHQDDVESVGLLWRPERARA